MIHAILILDDDKDKTWLNLPSFDGVAPALDIKESLHFRIKNVTEAFSLLENEFLSVFQTEFVGLTVNTADGILFNETVKKSTITAKIHLLLALKSVQKSQKSNDKEDVQNKVHLIFKAIRCEQE